MKIRVLAMILALVCFALPAGADEGMWQLDEFDEELFARMQELGLELSREEIYQPGGRGLAYAIVDLGGGTGSFVSDYGLILTNHHVAFAAIQRASTEEDNYIENGFYAERSDLEIPAPGYEAQVLVAIRDVTDEILGAAGRKKGAERHKAIEDRIKELQAGAEEKSGDIRATVASFYGGMQYKMFTYFRIKDVRLVYAPPRSIGNYGGDIDNWMWPRHTGDFSFLRAYVAPDGSSADYSEDNVAYEPSHFLPMSGDGVGEGDFTMIIGFPGQTMRYRSSYSIAWSQDWRFPQRIKMFGDIIDIYEELGSEDPGVKIKVAQFDAMLNNAMKNYQGQLEGFRKAGLLAGKIAEEQEFAGWVEADKDRKKRYGEALPRIKELYEKQELYRDKSAVAGLSGFLVQMMQAASTIYRWTGEKDKPDMEREPRFMERNIDEIRMRLRMIDRGYDETVDRAVLTYFLEAAHELPEGQRIEAIDEAIESAPGGTVEEKIAGIVDRLYSGTKLGDTEERMRMFELSREELMAEGDPFIEFYAELHPEVEKMEDLDEEFSGNISMVRPKLIEGMRQWRGGAFYPDANGMMRLTYGTVKGYVPRDAVYYHHITRLAGAVEKHTGEDPFDCPPELIELWKDEDFGEYHDDRLGDVPVAFLSTCDITGGNSGSPIINGRGECVGAAFDGNWESISADYLFNEDLTRAISVESRYILFILEKYSKAYGLLGEMKIQ